MFRRTIPITGAHRQSSIHDLGARCKVPYERRTTIEIKDHDVWLLRQAGAIPAHPSLHGGVTAGARALGYDAALAEGGSEDNDKGLTHTSHMVMATVVWRRMPWGK